MSLVRRDAPPQAGGDRPLPEDAVEAEGQGRTVDQACSQARIDTPGPVVGEDLPPRAVVQEHAA